jgi:photosystem II stability/assembly factor-like uncharacterized protein
MKKPLLSLAMAFSLGAMAQVVPSSFWTNQNSNFSIASAGVRYMDVVDANVVWGIGYDGTKASANWNEFTRTINGGSSYTSGFMYPDTLTYHPSSIEAISADTAWVTAYLNSSGNKGAIHQTTNGGATWNNMTAVGMYTNNASFADFTCFFTPSVGVTVGDPVGGEFEIWRTTNAGQTWTKIPGASIANPSSSGEYALTDVYFKLGTTDCWFGTNLGRVLHSSDAGLTWTAGSIGATPYVNDIAFRDNMNGLLITSASTLYQTTNGGASWTQISPIDPNMGLNGICNIPGTTWYASCGAGTGNNVISYSFDDGISWNSWGGSNVQYLEIEFVSNVDGYAGGFSDPFNATIDGMFRFNGMPLGIKNSGAPLSETDVYPNPSSGSITLGLPASKEGASIIVVDAMGKTVYSENVKNMSFERHTINLDHLAKGIYSVNVIRPTGTQMKKIVIQ